MTRNFLQSAWILGAATCAAAQGLAASPDKATPAAASIGKGDASTAAPDVTTARHGDWIVRCQQAATDSIRQCEAVQTLAVEGRPIARIAVGRVQSSGEFAVAVNLPANVAFAAAVKLGSEANSLSPLSLAWRRCLASGCYADVFPAPAEFKRWQSQSGAGELRFLEGNGNVVLLPYSFKGLGEAIEELNRK